MVILLPFYDPIEPGRVAERQAVSHGSRNTLANGITHFYVGERDYPFLIIWADPQLGQRGFSAA
ncbi:MAG: hypothetical protein F6K09_05645 [Merismopedia sp. SIO2A8]|nr:hypothetical protein [Merismopedia sp. SIO2A8]